MTRPFWVFVGAAFVVFWSIAYFVPPKPLAEAIRFLQISAAFAVVVAYSGEAWKAGVKKRLGADDYLILGISLSWLSAAMLGMLLLTWRLLGQPSWLVNNDFANFLLAMSMLSAILHLLAPGAIGGVVPRKNTVRVGCVVGVAFFLAAITMTQTSRISAFVKMLRPFIEEPSNKYDAPSNLLYKSSERTTTANSAR